MSRQFTREFLIEVALGNVPGFSILHKFGRNDGVPSGSFEFINLLGFTGWPLSAATTVRIKAGGDIADTAAGAGAREITVVGIDDSLNEVSEAIATAGASASGNTTASFWRIYRAYVSSAGTYGAANTAAVTIENSAGGTDIIQIATEEGQSQFGGYSVPSGKTGYLLGVHGSVDASKAADIRCFIRENLNDASAPVASKRIQFHWDGVVGAFNHGHPALPEITVPALTDIWFEARGGGAGTEVSIDFDILLKDD